MKPFSIGGTDSAVFKLVTDAVPENHKKQTLQSLLPKTHYISRQNDERNPDILVGTSGLLKGSSYRAFLEKENVEQGVTDDYQEEEEEFEDEEEVSVDENEEREVNGLN